MASVDTDKAPKKKRGLVVPVVLLVIFLAIAAAGGVYLVRMNSLAKDVAKEQGSAPVPQNPSKEEEEADAKENELPANPVDFAPLKVENPDIYAWLTIPNTNINVPILQSTVDDNYYLDHGRDGKANPYGAVFTQSMNKTDFSDPVTVVYAHDSDKGPSVLFHDLHDFEDADFFKKNADMYIYTPGHILTYKVVAAYEYDDRHIMNSFDFSNPQVLQDYYNSVLNPASLRSNVREGASLDASSNKIVQLSTCMLDQWHGPNRYIVTGVLVNDQATR